MKKTAFNLACSAIALTCSAAAMPAWAQSQEAAAPQDDKAAPSIDDKSKIVAAEDASEIVVTGTSISGVKPVGTEAIVINRIDAEKTGFTTPAELLRTLPQVRTGEFDREGGASTISIQNAGGSNSVTLRGLGSTSSTTLILVDGRRTVGSGASYTTIDANQVPLAAIERVEVVADGASAVYGSDAIGGVINYILRKDYKGVELSARGNNTQGGFEYGLSGTGGLSWNAGGLGAGNLLVTYDYAHRDPYIAGKNPYLRADLSQFGGRDRRIDGSNAMLAYLPSIVVTPPAASNPPANATLPNAGTSVYYGVPAGAGAGLTVGQLLVNQPDIRDFSYFTDYVGKLERHQVAAYLNQELGESVELFVQGRYSDRETLTRTTEGIGGGGARNVALRSRLRNAAGAVTNTPNPYYVANVPGVSQGTPAGFITLPGFPFPIPVPATPAADLTVLYPALKDGGARTYFASDKSVNVTGGLRVKLPWGWESEASYTFGRNHGCTYCQVDGSFINQEAFQYQVDIGAINPLSSDPLSPAILSKVSGSQQQIGHNGIDDLLVKFNGPLFDLPGGTVKAAFGGERNKVQNWNENTSVTGVANVPTVLTNKANSYYSRTITSAFAEVYAPLVGEDMDVPLMKKFVVSGAVRYDRYNDAGSSTNPKFGFTWDVADILSFGGTWGTSFRAPSITDKNPAAYVSGIVFPLTPLNAANLDPNIPPSFCLSLAPGAPPSCFTTGGLLFGSNPNLRPEKATNWSLSAQLKPGGGFRASVNYYNIHFRDRLAFPNVLGALATGPINGGYGGLDDKIVPINNNPLTCRNTDITTADPALQPYLQTPIYGAGSGVSQLGGFANFCDIRVLVDQRFTNISQTFTDGLDLNVSWDGLVGEVALSASATANVILNYKERVAANGPEQNVLGLLKYPLKWRGRGSLSAFWRGASATMFANYTGSFTNNEARGPLNQILPNQKVPSYTTFDLNLGYTTDFAGRNSPLKNLRYSMTVQNLFNDYPPLVFQSNRVIADQHGIPFGRTFAFQITAGF